MANITTLEFEGFYYIQAGDIFAKGCSRCGGTGHYSFNGFDSICYKCHNIYELRLGDIFENEAAAQKWCHGRAVRKAQADRKRAAEHQKKIDAAHANQIALQAADPEVFEFLMGIVIEDDTQHLFATYDEWAEQAQPVKLEKDGFIRTMAETLRWVGPSKPFTPNMIAAVRRTMEKRAGQAAKAAETPAPSGRVQVTGEIVSAKIVEGDYGTSYKAVVKDDQGFRVWVSIPSSLMGEFFSTVDYTDIIEGLKGRRLTFAAALEVSADDVSFAFGKRPTKGAWI
jgi:hypothetical protein